MGIYMQRDSRDINKEIKTLQRVNDSPSMLYTSAFEHAILHAQIMAPPQLVDLSPCGVGNTCYPGASEIDPYRNRLLGSKND
jgi:hypothetical protein